MISGRFWVILVARHLVSERDSKYTVHLTVVIITSLTVLEKMKMLAKSFNVAGAKESFTYEVKAVVVVADVLIRMVIVDKLKLQITKKFVRVDVIIELTAAMPFAIVITIIVIIANR